MGSDGGWAQVGGGYVDLGGGGVCGFRWGGGYVWSGGVGLEQAGGVQVGGCSGGGVSEGGSKGANVRGIEGVQRDKSWGGGGGELNGIFLQFEFRF